MMNIHEQVEALLQSRQEANEEADRLRRKAVLNAALKPCAICGFSNGIHDAVRHYNKEEE